MVGNVGLRIPTHITHTPAIGARIVHRHPHLRLKSSADLGKGSLVLGHIGWSFGQLHQGLYALPGGGDPGSRHIGPFSQPSPHFRCILHLVHVENDEPGMFCCTFVIPAQPLHPRICRVRRIIGSVQARGRRRARRKPGFHFLVTLPVPGGQQRAHFFYCGTMPFRFPEQANGLAHIGAHGLILRVKSNGNIGEMRGSGYCSPDYCCHHRSNLLINYCELPNERWVFYFYGGKTPPGPSVSTWPREFAEHRDGARRIQSLADLINYSNFTFPTSTHL